MKFHASSLTRFLVFVILAVSTLSCGVSIRTSNAPNTAVPFTASPVELATATPRPTAVPTYTSTSSISTDSLTNTPRPPLVKITAVNGNLYIRRGSGSDFNPIGALMQGQTATVLGRDILNQWLYIPIPKEPDKFGWVSTLTIYSSIAGDTKDLPVVDSPLAIPAFIENCSIHNMMIEPVGIILPPGNQFPDNIVRFDPGVYTYYDYDLSKIHGAATIDLSEGETYQLTARGTVAQHKCP